MAKEKRVDVVVGARDEASKVFNQVAANARGTLGGIGGGAGGPGTMGQAGGGGFLGQIAGAGPLGSLFAGGLKLNAVTMAVSMGADALGGTLKLLSGDVEEADQAFRKMPAGVGQMYGKISDLALAISGITEKIKAHDKDIAETNARMKMSESFVASEKGFREQAGLIGLSGPALEAARAAKEYRDAVAKLEETYYSKPKNERGSLKLMNDAAAAARELYEAKVNESVKTEQQALVAEFNAVQVARINAQKEGYDKELALLEEKHRAERQAYKGQAINLLQARQEYEKEALANQEAARKKAEDEANAQQVSDIRRSMQLSLMDEAERRMAQLEDQAQKYREVFAKAGADTGDVDAWLARQKQQADAAGRNQPSYTSSSLFLTQAPGQDAATRLADYAQKQLEQQKRTNDLLERLATQPTLDTENMLL